MITRIKTTVNNKKRNNYPRRLSFWSQQKKLSNLKIGWIVFFKQTANNTFITVKNRKNKVVMTRSCGMVGFKGPKRGGYYASTVLSRLVSKDLSVLAKRRLSRLRVVILSKLTKNIKLAVKNIAGPRVRVSEIIERIPVCHNGLRRPSIRRL